MEEHSLVDVVGVVGRLLWGSRVGGRGTPWAPFPSCSAARVRRVEKFPPPNICERITWLILRGCKNAEFCK